MAYEPLPVTGPLAVALLILPVLVPARPPIRLLRPPMTVALAMALTILPLLAPTSPPISVCSPDVMTYPLLDESSMLPLLSPTRPPTRLEAAFARLVTLTLVWLSWMLPRLKPTNPPRLLLLAVPVMLPDTEEPATLPKLMPTKPPISPWPRILIFVACTLEIVPKFRPVRPPL